MVLVCVWGGVPVLATVTSEHVQLKRKVLGGNVSSLLLSLSGIGIFWSPCQFPAKNISGPVRETGLYCSR